MDDHMLWMGTLEAEEATPAGQEALAEALQRLREAAVASGRVVVDGLPPDGVERRTLDEIALQLTNECAATPNHWGKDLERRPGENRAQHRARLRRRR